jgi:hypothetical protein
MAALAAVSCGRAAAERPVIPPPTDPLRRAFIGYGVVSVYYPPVLDEPGGGNTLGYLRRGSLVRVLERRPPEGAGSAEPWVLVEGTCRGWLPERVIQVYENEAQARTAAESLAP